MKSKYLIIERQHYDSLRKENLRLLQEEEDFFKGKRCQQYRVLQAEIDMLHDNVARYQKIVQQQSIEIEQYRGIIRDLCGAIVLGESEDERRVP